MTVDQAVEKSIGVILEFQQDSGAYPASPNLSAYHYSWFRDGAFVADAMSRAGQVESAERFFAWCARIITDRRGHILDGAKLDARYTYDGRESTEKWETYQLDGYGILLWAMQQHAARHGRSIGQYQEAAGLIQHYLSANWREPCFDWWEERLGRHAASLACIYAGLDAYRHPDAALVKAAIDLSQESTDSSLLVCGLFGAVNAETFAPMLQRIESEIVSESGGVWRYHDDTYYGGGEWLVCTGLLGWYYQRLGRTQDAQKKLDWMVARVRANGWLPEQTQEHLLYPEQFDPWVTRWGRPADPLLWSQAMLITLASELS